MSIVFEIATVIALIMVNGFLAMSELALVSSRRGRLEEMAHHGNRGAATAARLIDDPTSFLSTVQVGITLVGISVANLADDGIVQLTLPFERRSASALDTVLDDVRERFGTSALTRAVHLGRDQGFTVPMLPD